MKKTSLFLCLSLLITSILAYFMFLQLVWDRLNATKKRIIPKTLVHKYN